MPVVQVEHILLHIPQVVVVEREQQEVPQLQPVVMEVMVYNLV
jgi:hypothetical protein